MKLRDLVMTCGNELRFIKVYFDLGDEEKEFDKNRPDYIYSKKEFILPHLLNAPVECWHVDRKNNDLEVLLS